MSANSYLEDIILHQWPIKLTFVAGTDDGVPAASLERVPGRHAREAVQPPGGGPALQPPGFR